VFFEENYIPVMWPKFQLNPAVNNRVETPLIKLFPAAKVTVEPRVEGKPISLGADWIVEEHNNPEWTAMFLKSPMICGTGIKPNQVNTFYVPAGLRFRPKLSVPSNWCPVIFEQVIYLQQGQTLDLGKCTLQPAIQISARVVSSAGEPVEGVPVRAIFDGHGTVAHNSDANGIVRFHVPSNSKGEFVINYVDCTKGRELLRETMPFEVGSESRQFMLKISDEMLNLLFK
jgi:hypothetical protein